MIGDGSFLCHCCGGNVELSDVEWDTPDFECGCLMLHGNTDCPECGASMDVDLCLAVGEGDVEVEVTSCPDDDGEVE